MIFLCTILSFISLCGIPSARAKGTSATDDIITITSPANSTAATSGFIVTANARPAVAGAVIEGMILRIDGVEYGPIIRADNLSVPVNVGPGTHVYSVSAWDTSGATGFSPNYSFSVLAGAASGVVTPSGSSVSNYYVAQDGNDSNPGTLQAPWSTLQHAMDSATPGSIVNIRGGTYHERLAMHVSGTSGNYITFQPYGFNVPSGGCSGYTGVPCSGDQVILDYSYLGTVKDGVPLLQISGRDFVRVRGLTFQNLTCTGAMQQGIRIDANSSYIEFNNNTFLNNRNVYPSFDGTAALLFFRIWRSNYVTVNSNHFGNINTVMSEVVTVSDGATNSVVENNYIHDTDGIAISSWSGANNFSFVHNKVEYIGIRRDGSVWYDNPAVAIYDDGGYSGMVQRNIVSHAGVGYEALSETGQPDTHDITISNNIAADCVNAGIVIGTWYSRSSGSSIYNLAIYNNTFYGNGVGVQIQPMTSATVTWENNIFANNRTNYYNPLNWNPGTTGYNLYYGSNVGPGPNNVTGNPQFSNAAAGDFSLQAASAAIGAGAPNTPQAAVGLADYLGNARTHGGAIDIGAYGLR